MKKTENKKIKDFDCIKMKNEIQSKLYEKMKHLSFKEQREFIEKSLKSKLVAN